MCCAMREWHARGDARARLQSGTGASHGAGAGGMVGGLRLRVQKRLHARCLCLRLHLGVSVRLCLRLRLRLRLCMSVGVVWARRRLHGRHGAGAGLGGGRGACFSTHGSAVLHRSCGSGAQHWEVGVGAWPSDWHAVELVRVGVVAGAHARAHACTHACTHAGAHARTHARTHANVHWWRVMLRRCCRGRGRCCRRSRRMERIAVLGARRCAQRHAGHGVQAVRAARHRRQRRDAHHRQLLGVGRHGRGGRQRGQEARQVAHEHTQGGVRARALHVHRLPQDGLSVQRACRQLRVANVVELHEPVARACGGVSDLHHVPELGEDGAQRGVGGHVGHVEHDQHPFVPGALVGGLHWHAHAATDGDLLPQTLLERLGCGLRVSNVKVAREVQPVRAPVGPEAPQRAKQLQQLRHLTRVPRGRHARHAHGARRLRVEHGRQIQAEDGRAGEAGGESHGSSGSGCCGRGAARQCPYRLRRLRRLCRLRRLRLQGALGEHRTASCVRIRHQRHWTLLLRARRWRVGVGVAGVAGAARTARGTHRVHQRTQRLQQRHPLRQRLSRDVQRRGQRPESAPLVRVGSVRVGRQRAALGARPLSQASAGQRPDQPRGRLVRRNTLTETGATAAAAHGPTRVGAEAQGHGWQRLRGAQSCRLRGRGGGGCGTGALRARLELTRLSAQRAGAEAGARGGERAVQPIVQLLCILRGRVRGGGAGSCRRPRRVHLAAGHARGGGDAAAAVPFTGAAGLAPQRPPRSRRRVRVGRQRGAVRWRRGRLQGECPARRRRARAGEAGAERRVGEDRVCGGGRSAGRAGGAGGAAAGSDSLAEALPVVRDIARLLLIRRTHGQARSRRVQAARSRAGASHPSQVLRVQRVHVRHPPAPMAARGAVQGRALHPRVSQGAKPQARAHAHAGAVAPVHALAEPRRVLPRALRQMAKVPATPGPHLGP
mmetsp:Transcript_29652/g.96932  ORF Transcript_29652/g.96932 Transcript_29652/m.96932 type:complete len:945 (+) Transcript_29652:1669-4503(+)